MTRVLALLLAFGCGTAAAQVDGDSALDFPTTAPAPREPAPLALLPSLIEVELRLDRATLPVGSPVMGEFVIRNRSLDPVTLQVPGTLASPLEYQGMGLPLEHIFSADNFRGLRIAAEGNPALGDRVAMRPEYPVPPLTIAPLASVGLKFDLARFYPVLHQSGRYELSWAPYGGAIASPPVVLEVAPYKIVVLETTQGRLTLRLLYDKAPRTVSNFLELVADRFYDGLTFHRVEPHFVAVGGCPLGNGTGRRPDGRTLEPEFNDTPFTLGSVGMSLTPGDVRSASCQFFIALGRQEFLDGNYTLFAQVEGPDSMETLRRINSIQTDERKRPLEPLAIKSAVIMNATSLR